MHMGWKWKGREILGFRIGLDEILLSSQEFNFVYVYSKYVSDDITVSHHSPRAPVRPRLKARILPT